MRQNRITIISIYYPPEQGAAASRLSTMARGLQARNQQVEVITALPNYPTGRIFDAYRGRFSCSEVIDNIPVRRLWLYPSNSTVAVKRILNIVSFALILFCAIPQLIRCRTGLIIVNSPPLAAGFSGILLAKLVRARAVVNVSDIWPLSALELGAIRKGLLYSLLETVERSVYRLSDAVVTQSCETQQHVLQRFPDKKTFLYRNLDRLSRFSHQYPSTTDRPLKIVYAGLLGVAQGVLGICKAIDFRKMGFELHLYGGGNEKARIHEYISENPGCNVFLHDIVPKSDLAKVLSQFHATVVPLRSNIRGAFPSKIYMAISASLPVLFCGSGEGASFVRESGIGWVAGPGDHSGLRKNLAALAAMSELDYQALRNRIRQVAATRYDLDEQLDRFMEFLDSVR